MATLCGILHIWVKMEKEQQAYNAYIHFKRGQKKRQIISVIGNGTLRTFRGKWCKRCKCRQKGKSSKTGNDYEQLIVNAVVMNVTTKQPIRSVSFSIFLSNTSQELQDFLYFTKQFDADGNIVLYDYVTRTGQKRDGSGSFSIDEYKQFQGIKIIAMLEFKGMSDKGNPIFEVKGFVSQKGQSAAEVNANSAPTKYATTWKLLTNYLLPETNAQLFHPGWIPPAQQQAQQVSQQATQPQQPVYPQQGTGAPNA